MIFNLIRRLFRKESEFENEAAEEQEDSKTELDLVLDHYEQNKEEIRKWDSKNLLTRIELDRQAQHYKIRFCFIPKSQNYKNVRSYLQYNHGGFEKWQALRRHFIKKHNSTCQCCGRQFKELELHEHWSFNDYDREQKLESLILLCEQCHSIAHITRHKRDPAKIDELLELYCEYNKVDNAKAWEDFEFHETLREKRNQTQYQLDLSVLNGIELGNFVFDIRMLFNCHTDRFNAFIEKFKADSKDKE